MPEYNKLVRDYIPMLIAGHDVQARYKHLTDNEEYLEALIDKLIEECLEFAAMPTDEELADVIEVIAALRQFYPDIDEMRTRKLTERGGFDKRIFLISTEDEDGDQTPKSDR